MTLEQQVSDNSGPITISSTVVTIVGGLTLSEWLAVTGILVTLVTCGVNWYYKHKTFKHLRHK